MVSMCRRLARAALDMELRREAVVLLLLFGAVVSSPLVNDLAPGSRFPGRESVQQPSSIVYDSKESIPLLSEDIAPEIPNKPDQELTKSEEPIITNEPVVKTEENVAAAEKPSTSNEPVPQKEESIPQKDDKNIEVDKPIEAAKPAEATKANIKPKPIDNSKVDKDERPIWDSHESQKKTLNKLPIQEIISESKNEEINQKAEKDNMQEEEIPSLKTVELGKNDIVKVDYSGAQLWKIPTSKPGNRVVIARLRRRNLITTWGGNHTAIDILVKPNAIENVTKAFERENIPYDIIIEDLQKRIEEENPPLDENELQLQDRRGHRMTWKQYHRADDIYGFLDYLAKTYPSLITLQTVGKSYEGRDMKVLKISDGKPNNKAVFIDGGIHAREWISPATVTYFINQIAENFDDESEDFKNIDWYFMPLVNPDGYEYTHLGDRLWRKNRRPSGVARVCSGADLNRNFGYRWGGKGASNNPCSEIYRGGRPFSEPESKALSDFIKNSGVKFVSYLSYHSYGQYILYPWGYDNALPPDYEDLDSVGKKMAEAIQQLRGTKYSVGSSSGLLYPAAGGSDDWAKAQGIKYAYTIELSDTGRYGFVLPTTYIEPVARESLAALRVLAAQIHKE